MTDLLIIYIIGLLFWLYSAGKYDADGGLKTFPETLSLVAICIIWPLMIPYFIGWHVQRGKNCKIGEPK